MKHFAGFLATVALIFALTAKAAAQAPQVSPQTPPAPPSRTIPYGDPKTPRPDAGRVADSTYFNDYFGLQLMIPQGWTVHDAETNKKIMEAGKDIVKADNAAQQAAYDASVQRTLTLLTITPGSTLASSTSGFQCMAERLPGALSARDYLTLVKSLLMKTGKVVEFERDIYTEMIDGVEFAGIQTVIKYPEGALKQKYRVTIRKGFALGFINTYADEESGAALDKIIKAIKLTALKAQ